MKEIRNKKAITAFVGPALIVYSCIVILPIIISLFLAFTEWNGMGKVAFVGLKNFQRLVEDKTFRMSFKNNLIYIVIVVGMQMLLGMFLAVLLTYVKRGRGILQTVFYLPATITVVAIAQLFNCFYSVTPVGLFNKILGFFGKDPVLFLQDFKTVLPAVSVVEGWQYIGIYMIIFYSALVSISEELVEAAKLDGANTWQILWKIKFPNIANVIGLAIIMSLVSALKGFAVSYNLTSGGPSHRSELLATYLYKTAFANTEYGYGSSIALLIMLLSLGCILVINRFVSVDGKDAD